MGKHTIAEYIHESVLHLPIIQLDKTINEEYISNIYRSVNPYIYLIDLTQFQEKQQNIILKFLEEPVVNSFIILLANNREQVLPTITNRCVSFDLEPYSREELSTFITIEDDPELILTILKTPGQIKNTNTKTFKEMFDICDKIVTKLSQASYTNTLSILNKINFTDQYDKFDLSAFLNTLVYILSMHYMQTNSINVYKMLMVVLQYLYKLKDQRLNKELLTSCLLSDLWKIAHGEC